MWTAIETKQGTWPSFWNVIRKVSPGHYETAPGGYEMSKMAAEAYASRLNGI